MMKISKNDKCPQCGKAFLATAREDPKERVLKARLIKFRIDGPTVSAKCRQCGLLVGIPSLKAIN
jgi:hypothetical protein